MKLSFLGSKYPKTELTRKNIPFIWTPEKQKSFDNIKQVLASFKSSASTLFH